MSRLDKAANSVPAGSPPADPDLNTDPAAASPDPMPEGNTGDTGEPADGKSEGRSLENVQREFQRKMDKMAEQNAQMAAEMAAMRAESTAPTPTAPAANQTLDDMTVTQLEGMRANVPDDNKAAFDAYLIERKAEERVDARLSKFEQNQSFVMAETKANEQAFSRWPQLHDPSSQFYQNTNRILQEMGPSADQNPQAVLHAANEAGLDLGVAPQTFRPQITRRDPGELQSGRTSRPTGKAKDTIDVNSSEHAKIQQGLANAMPGRKFTKEQKDRIAQRAKQYQDNIDLFTRG